MAQDSRPAVIVRHGDTDTLRIESSRPLESAAVALAEHYQLHVNVEDPPYLYPDDLRDRTAEVDRSASPPFRIVVPAGGSLAVSYAIDRAGRPLDTEALPGEIVSAYNRRFPFEYRLDRRGDLYTFVAIASRDVTGRRRRVVPVLDHPIEIEGGERPMRDRLESFGEALSREVHALVACCGESPALRFLERRAVRGSIQGPAREVLMRLTEELGIHFQWLVRYDPPHGSWIVHLRPIRSETGGWLRWPNSSVIVLPPLQAPGVDRR